jgi:hypothetical protein
MFPRPDENPALFRRWERSHNHVKTLDRDQHLIAAKDCVKVRRHVIVVKHPNSHAVHDRYRWHRIILIEQRIPNGDGGRFAAPVADSCLPIGD